MRHAVLGIFIIFKRQSRQYNIHASYGTYVAIAMALYDTVQQYIKRNNISLYVCGVHSNCVYPIDCFGYDMSWLWLWPRNTNEKRKIRMGNMYSYFMLFFMCMQNGNGSTLLAPVKFIQYAWHVITSYSHIT